MTEPQQGLSYEEQLALARRAETLGFEAFFRSDHYQSFPGPAGRPTTDAWTVLAGLARETTRIHIGALVSPITFRLPGVLAKVVATVDAMSGGRVELGMGAGWNEDEHAQLGIPFPGIAERADRLEEALEVVHGLFEGPDGWSFHGRHYRVDDALFRPRPIGGTGPGGRPRIIVGGEGSPRGLRLAARWADEFNLSSSSPEIAREKFAQLDRACAAIGREPGTIARSVMAGVLVGGSEAEVARRESALIEAVGGAGDPKAWLEQRRPRWIHGTPDRAREAVERFADAGAQRIMLQDMLPWDLEMVDAMGEALVGKV